MERKRPKKPRGVAIYIEGRCTACGARCQAACPTDGIEMTESGEPIIIAAKCIGCKKCVTACPSDAIEMYFTPDEEKILAEYSRASQGLDGDASEQEESPSPIAGWKGVWVYVEHMQGAAHSVSWELLGAGRKLANDLGVELCAMILGEDIDALANEAAGYGAEKVFVVSDPALKYYRTSAYVHAGVNLIKKHKPEIVLIGATGQGRDLAGAMATDLMTGLTTDCTGLDISLSDRLLEQTRPAFGGNIMAAILTERARPQMSTVRPHVMPRPQFEAWRQPNVIREPFDLPEDRIAERILEILPIKAEDAIDLAAAHIIVSGGRGMMGAENFGMLHELAQLLGGVVGCSRSAVDAGWGPHERQVGQTGKTVMPKLYIACGISGAIQHLVGMQGSDHIIAINKDPNAPIFSVAHLGLVGDVFEIVPALIERVRKEVPIQNESLTAVGAK